MVRNYVRKTERGKVPEDIMLRAVLQVKEHERSIRAVSQEYGIPRKTLGRYCKKFKNTTEASQPRSTEADEPLPQTTAADQNPQPEGVQMSNANERPFSRFGYNKRFQV